MNAEEYEKVKGASYSQYCVYLQKKYGLPKSAYMNEMWGKTQGITRTREGLFIHHIREDTAVMLSDPAHAKKAPYSYQLPENLCYCDWLEHLYLHVLICEHPARSWDGKDKVGIEGVMSFFVPELNDLYSGCRPGKPWRQTCFKKVEGERDVYIALLRRFVSDRKREEGIAETCAALYSSSADGKGWSLSDNYDLWCEAVSPFVGRMRRKILARRGKPLFAAFRKTGDTKKMRKRHTLLAVGVVVLALVLLSVLLL
ncbi:MAG: hypothetical protein LUD72_08835 [Bacteroidales bacterium]|nr:hypothetical protein [Bacteroidales bacterium]